MIHLGTYYNIPTKYESHKITVKKYLKQKKKNVHKIIEVHTVIHRIFILII